MNDSHFKDRDDAWILLHGVKDARAHLTARMGLLLTFATPILIASMHLWPRAAVAQCDAEAAVEREEERNAEPELKTCTMRERSTIVKRGQTFLGIALANSMTQSELLKLNADRVRHPDVLPVGTELRLRPVKVCTSQAVG